MSRHFFRCRLLFVVLLAGLSMGSLAIGQDSQSDWLQFRGAGGQGVSSSKGLPTKWNNDENVAWSIEIPGAGTSSPVIQGNRVYLTYYSGYNVPRHDQGDQEDLLLHLVCLNRENGETIWHKEIKPKLPEQEKIRDEHGYASSTPAVDDKRIYVFFGKSGVFAFDLEGTQLWNTAVGENLHGWGSAASPVLHDGLVFINASVESESLVALNQESGEEAWRVRGINEAWNTPVFVETADHGTELAIAIFGKIVGLNPKSGEKYWSCETDIGWYMVPTLAVHGDMIYAIGGRSGGGLALRGGGRGDVTGSHRTWTINKGSNVSSPVYHDGLLFWISDAQGIAYCADAETGNIHYQQRVTSSDQFYASAVLGDGKVYYLSRYGTTYVVAAQKKYKLLASNLIGDAHAVFNATPAIAGNQLFIRSDTHLYCIANQK